MPLSPRPSPHDIYPDEIEATLADLHAIAEAVQRAQERQWRRHGMLLPADANHEYRKFPLGNPQTKH